MGVRVLGVLDEVMLQQIQIQVRLKMQMAVIGGVYTDGTNRSI